MKIVENLPQLERLGIHQPNRVYWQLNTPQLYEQIVRRFEGMVAHLGPLVVRTGTHTSRAHEDRFIVSEPPFQGDIAWGEINRAFSPDRFAAIQRRMTAYFRGLDVFVQDVYVRTDHHERMPVRVITETAWHSLFTRNTYIYAERDELDSFLPEYTVIHAPGFRAVPKRDGTNSDVFVLIDLAKRLILIGGTSYAGEIKKAIFSVMNYLLPKRDILSVEGAANMGDKGDVALFLGVFGTGKTTLATDTTRHLIGESEHGWGAQGIFNIGRGCYANVLGVSPESAPEIYETTRRFGTLLENVSVDVIDRQLDLNDSVFTENTRACYPISHIANANRDGFGGHPTHIFMLTMDAFGVLPPVSKLTHDQAHYHFLTGYTSELVTTRHNTIEPRATFSACYGAPFMPLHPGLYAKLFAEKIRHHNVNVWLLNTGWTGGAYGEGQRISLDTTRAVVRAVLSGALDHVEMVKEPYFGLNVPTQCPDVPAEILNPRSAWRSPDAYDVMAKELTRDFDENFAQYSNEVDPHLLAVQPTVG